MIRAMPHKDHGFVRLPLFRDEAGQAVPGPVQVQVVAEQGAPMHTW